VCVSHPSTSSMRLTRLALGDEGESLKGIERGATIFSWQNDKRTEARDYVASKSEEREGERETDVDDDDDGDGDGGGDGEYNGNDGDGGVTTQQRLVTN